MAKRLYDTASENYYRERRKKTGGKEQHKPDNEYMQRMQQQKELYRPTIARDSIELLDQVSGPEALERYKKSREAIEPEYDAVDMLKAHLTGESDISPQERRALIQQTAEKLTAEKNRITERKQQAEELAKNYGWKRTGNQAVYATPFSPLPKPTQENTATRATAPGAFGIAPRDYVGAMENIDRFNQLKEQGAPKSVGMEAVESEEGKRFLNKWFPEQAEAGMLPTEDEVRAKYTQLDPWQQDSYWMEWMANEAALSPLMLQDVQTAAYEKELSEAQAARDEALKLLGADAEKLATGRTADYYDQYGNEYRAADQPGKTEPLLTLDPRWEDFDLETAKRLGVNPYMTDEQQFDAQRWGILFPGERKTYELMRNVYGQEEADNYLLSLRGYLNERLMRHEAALAQQYATEHPIMSNVESIISAPFRGLPALGGMAEQILTGKEMDKYDPRLNPVRRTENIRGQTTQNIGGGVKGFLYQTLMSIGDNLANVVAFGGLGSVASKAVGLSMFGNAAASSYNDVIERTGDTDQATAAALLSGIVEGVFEKYEIDGFLNMVTKGMGANAVLDVLKQMGVEGVGEGATAIANEIADRLVMGEKSNYETKVTNLMMQGMSEEEARKSANVEVAKEIGLSALGGAISGGVMGGVATGINRLTGTNVQEAEQRESQPVQQETQLQQPAQPVRVEREVTGQRPAQEVQTEQPVQEPVRVEREITGKRPDATSEVSQQQAETTQPAAEEGKKENAANAPKKGKDGKTFRVERAVTVRRSGVTQEMNVTGVEDVSGGNVFMRAQTADGETEIVSAGDIEFADPVQQELMSYTGIGRMDANGVRNYLDGYDASIATPQQYAQAFESAYQDGKAGLDYMRMLQDRRTLARRYLTEGARQAAYAAGTRANLLDAKTTKYQKIVTEALNRAAGGKIRFTDEGIPDNGYYDPKTGEIVISKNADKGAYAYIAVHELGHKLKAENASAWGSFQTLVEDALLVNGVDIDERIAHTKELYKKRGQDLTTEEALEEVICNSAAAILQDEKIVRDMVSKDRTLMERVADFLREFVDRLSKAITDAGESMSELGSWKQLKALKDDRDSMEKIYHSLMDALEGTKEDLSAGNDGVVKMSVKEMTDGKKYVVVDTDQDIFEGHNPKEYPRIVRNYIKSHFRGTVIGEGTNRAYVDSTTFQEYTNPAKALEQNAFEAKMKAATELDNMMKASEHYGHNEPDMERHPEFPGGFDLYDVVFQVSDELFQGRLNIGIDSRDRKRLYDLTKIKNLDAGIWVKQHETAAQTSKGSIISISEEGKNVNRKLSVKEDTEGNTPTEEQQEYFANSKVRDENGAVKKSVSESFEAEYDAWAKEKKMGQTIKVGTTADVLVGLGAKKQTVIMRSEDIVHALRHDGMTDGVMKQIPQMMENPIIVMKSSQLGNKNNHQASRVVMYGNVNDENGVPVIAVLELRERMQGGQILDMQLVKNAYGKDNRLDVQIQKSEILYLDTNKKRTNRWLHSLGLQLPSDTTNYGSIGSISYSDGYVKMDGVMYGDLVDETAGKKMNTTENTDIRYSVRETSEAVQEELQQTADAFEQVRYAHRITAAEADALAGRILKEANSDYDRAELAEEIAQIYNYVESAETVNMDYVDDMQTALMARVMDKSRVLDEEHEQLVDPIREYLKGTRIRLTESQREEAANITGSYGSYRRQMMGRVKLSSVNGTELDVVWEELHDINPEWFPENTPEGDMPGMLLEVVDALKPVYHTGMNTEETASWMAGKLNMEYLSLPAVKAAAKNQKGFTGSIHELRKTMARFEETTQEEFRAALETVKKSREGMVSEREEYEKAIQEKYRRQREKDSAQRRERELVNKQRARTEATVRTLLNWMDKPTDTKHVPAGLEEPLKEVLSALDFGGKNTKAATQLSERLERLATAIEGAQEKEDESRENFLPADQQMVDELRNVAQMIARNTSGRGVYDLSGKEMQQLNKQLGVVKHVLVNAGKMRGSNFGGNVEVQQIATETIDEINRKKPMKRKGWMTKRWEAYFGVDMMDSFTFFDRLGKTSTRVFQGLRDGFDVMSGLIHEAEIHTKKTIADAGVNNKELKKITGRRAEKIKYKPENSEYELELTKAHIMEIYALYMRGEQARGHMMEKTRMTINGEPKTIYGEGIIIRGDEDQTPHALTEKDAANLFGMLTEKEKKLADGLQKFLSTVCADWGNRASMMLLGYKKFGEEKYWPISTDPNTRGTTRLEENYAANIRAITSQGMTKQTVEGARNAIVIGDIFETYTRHISNMAAYSAYAVPLTDFTRWYNTQGVSRAIVNTMGAKGKEYINNLLMAVNGKALQSPKTGLEKAVGVLTRNAKTAAVGASTQVAIQQPTSYARAAAYINEKFLIKAAAMRLKKDELQLVNKYCGIAQWKRYGFYETNVGPNLRQIIVGDQTAMEWTRDKSMWLASVGDNWTLNHLWIACELETQKMMPELEKGSVAYYQHVGKRMSEIVDRTQVVDSPFHRSQMMRSKSFLAQTLTNFMSEPTKTFNMVTGALYEWSENRKNKAAQKRLAKTLTVCVFSAVLSAAAKSLTGAWNDEDEAEFAEKYMHALLGDYEDAETWWDYITEFMFSNVGSGLNPLGTMPGINELLSALQGYDSARLDQQTFQKVQWAIDETIKFFNGESKKSGLGVAYKWLQAMSSVVGIPFSNAFRDVFAGWRNITGYDFTLNTKAQKERYINHLYSAMQNEDKKKDASIRQKLRTEAGMSPKDIDTAIADRLSYDERIAKAWEAKKAGRVGDVNRTKNALSHEGFTGEMVDKAIASYGNRAEPKEEKQKDMDAQLTAKLYSYDDAMVAINAGASIADIKAMMSDMIADSDAKDPGKAVRDGLKGRIKKEYMAAYEKGNTAKMNSLKQVLTDAVEVKEEDIQKWIKERHADELRNAVDSYDSKAANAAVNQMRKDGKDDGTIKDSLSKYKQLYVNAMNNGDRQTAQKIKNMLMGLGLKGKSGKPLYTNDTFVDWMKKK